MGEQQAYRQSSWTDNPPVGPGHGNQPTSTTRAYDSAAYGSGRPAIDPPRYGSAPSTSSYSPQRPDSRGSRSRDGGARSRDEDRDVFAMIVRGAVAACAGGLLTILFLAALLGIWGLVSP